MMQSNKYGLIAGIEKMIILEAYIIWITGIGGAYTLTSGTENKLKEHDE